MGALRLTVIRAVWGELFGLHIFPRRESLGEVDLWGGNMFWLWLFRVL